MSRIRLIRSLVPMLAVAALLLPGRHAASDESAGDGAPPGAVVFFMMTDNGICPDGWKPATYATGRLVAGVTSADEVGVAVGTPLDDQEDRKHRHVYTGMIELPYKSVSAPNGGNASGAAAGMYPVADMTGEASSGLPFIQLLACEKQ